MQESRRPTGSIIDTYPDLEKAADVINVTPASLQRRIPSLLGRLSYADTTALFPPDVVLELARLYRSRDSSEVATHLLDLATVQAPTFVAELQAVIDALLNAEVVDEVLLDKKSFLAAAKRWLPPELYAQTESAINGELPLLGDDASGDVS